MYFDPYMAQRLAEEYMKKRQREAEQVRLIRAAKGPRKARKEWFNVVGAVLSGLVGFVAGR